MNTDTIHQLFKSYLEVYSAIPANERERLLGQIVTEDVVFTGPNEDGRGLGNLVEHIVEFQNKLPGAFFESKKILIQHGQLLSEWTMHKPDGTAIATGHTYARFNDQSRLTHLAGFFET